MSRGHEDAPPLLAHGLTAMARAKNWFDAHWGAALLAGHYLCDDSAIDETTREAIRAELAVLRKGHAEAVRPFAPADADPQASTRIAKSLEPALENGVRAHGHAVIYTALALRALGDAPTLAIPAITNRICDWNRILSKKKPTAPRHSEALPTEKTQDPNPAGVNKKLLARRTFERLADFAPLVGHRHAPRPNFTHWTTHTEALIRLDALGSRQLAQKGLLGLRAHLDFDVPPVPQSDPIDRASVTRQALLDARWWRDEERRAQWHETWNVRDNRNGDWIASGHLFKVLYAFTSLARLVDDPQLVETAAQVLFERYFDPLVGGG
ncbi:MAG: hypothetical protein KDC95_01220 [Planctomycetes bacterium]|nr:hypothetical protein [Planctomycetota bacterium]